MKKLLPLILTIFLLTSCSNQEKKEVMKEPTEKSTAVTTKEPQLEEFSYLLEQFVDADNYIIERRFNMLYNPINWDQDSSGFASKNISDCSLESTLPSFFPETVKRVKNNYNGIEVVEIYTGDPPFPLSIFVYGQNEDPASFVVSSKSNECVSALRKVFSTITEEETKELAKDY